MGLIWTHYQYRRTSYAKCAIIGASLPFIAGKTMAARMRHSKERVYLGDSGKVLCLKKAMILPLSPSKPLRNGVFIVKTLSVVYITAVTLHFLRHSSKEYEKSIRSYGPLLC